MNSVIKGTGYILVHTPDMVLHNGTTQTTQRLVDPDSDYLRQLPSHLRSYEDALGYCPNQTYIGACTPEELAALGSTWVGVKTSYHQRYGRFGEIMPQAEFLLLLQMCDVFDVVKLDADFVARHEQAVRHHPLYDQALSARLQPGGGLAEITRLVAEEQAEGLYHENVLVGCVKKAHDVDENLSAHVMLENLVSKASSVLSLLYAIHHAGIDKAQVDYVLDCCEEACGDMNQRGGGNFAKAAAEIAGLTNATGSDTRGFCAGPCHAIVLAASLIQAGTYHTVVVTAGGCTAKLGMNGKDHVKKGLPILEDMLGGFAVVLTENDGINPEIDLRVLGRHTVGTGSAPQAVISALVSEPLARAGLKILDIDKYSVEMQNPDITKPAGAGDVPLSNYKMIGALAAKNGEMTPKDLPAFVAQHGLVGWAPTQGHIPSGVPYLGFARQAMLDGTLRTAMIIGKGSLFLGRMTNLFDGVSFLLRKNSAAAEAASGAPVASGASVGSGAPAGSVRVAITALGNEHGQAEVLAGAVQAAARGISVTLLGTLTHPALTTIPVETQAQAHAKMEALLAAHAVDAAVTMHFPFPIGVSTVGRAVTPARGRELFLATTTGTADTNRVAGLVKNAISGIIAAKTCGLAAPTVGLLNIDGAQKALGILQALQKNGYPITLAASQRSDGGAILRGNDVLSGSADVMVTDPLTGNILSKMLSATATGGSYEAVGYGYGPGIGRHYDRLILILSRASGAPVIANAISYAAQLVRGNLSAVTEAEFALAEQAGLSRLLAACGTGEKPAAQAVAPPPAEVVTAALSGIEIMVLEDAVAVLWREGIYAQSGMGCTGPIILVSDANYDRAKALLKAADFLS